MRIIFFVIVVEIALEKWFYARILTALDNGFISVASNRRPYPKNGIAKIAKSKEKK